MATNLATQLHGVSESCLFTLNARARESRRPDAMFADPVAEAVREQLDIDSSRFDRDWLTQTGIAIRTEILDDACRAFIAMRDRSLVVNLGAGFCTRFFRVDDGALEWVDVDHDAVIGLRQTLMGPHRRCHAIAGSVLQDGWRTEVLRLAAGRPILLIAEGLLQYFSATQARRFMTSLAEDFSGADALVEVISPLAAAASRWQPSLRAIGVRARWGIGDPRAMERWSSRLRVVEVVHYDRHLERWRWLRRFRWVSPIRELMQIVHLRFASRSRCSEATSS